MNPITPTPPRPLSPPSATPAPRRVKPEGPIPPPAKRQQLFGPEIAAAAPALETDDYPVLTFLPGAPPSKEPGIANLIVSFFDHKDTARYSTISKGFQLAFRYTTTVRLDGKQRNIPHALEKYLGDEKNQLTPNRRVTELDLSNCNLSNEDLAFVAKYFPALKVLKFCGYVKKLTDLSPLKHLVCLQHLEMSGCTGLTDLTPLQSLGSLKHLEMSECDDLSDLMPLQNLGRLQHLDISKCSVSDLTPLQDLGSLKHLDIRRCTGLKRDCYEGFRADIRISR